MAMDPRKVTAGALLLAVSTGVLLPTGLVDQTTLAAGTLCALALAGGALLFVDPESGEPA